MRVLSVVSGVSRVAMVAALGVAASVAALACGDEQHTIRENPASADGGLADAGLQGPGNGNAAAPAANRLACGIAVPERYESAQFALNAATELALRERIEELETLMKSAEGPPASAAKVTEQELSSVVTRGVPSLRSVATAATQALLDEAIRRFAEVSAVGGKTWSPPGAAGADPDASASVPTLPASGGVFEDKYIVSSAGVDLRETTAKTLLGGALYNYALTLAAGPRSEALVDRLLVLFGATQKLANRTDADAGADEKDELVAEYASRRDNKVGPLPGPYRKIKQALLEAKAAAAAGEPCRADLDAALNVYFREWERTSFLTAIYYLYTAGVRATANPVQGAGALHAFGEAVGFIQGFRGIAQDRRIVTDAQITELLELIGAETPYKLLTNPAQQTTAFATSFIKIGQIYGLSSLDIEEAKKAY